MIPETDLDELDPQSWPRLERGWELTPAQASRLSSRSAQTHENPRIHITPAQPKLENKLRELIPYFDNAHLGFITFSRVPPHLRHIDGKTARQALENAGITDAKVYLTEKGKAWLAAS